MLRFQLGRIPVEVHFSHVLMSAVFGMFFVNSFLEPTQWPATGLADPATRSVTMAICVACWMGVISVSVLVHEMGHALASRAFGYSPSITLVALGGLTNPNAKGPIPWHRDVLLTLAGPMAGLALGLFSMLGADWFSHLGGARYIFTGAFVANVFWAGVNLLPVSPLDGGRISSAILTRIFGRRGFLFAQVLALVVGALVVVVAVMIDGIFLAVFFGIYAYRALSLINAYFRGEAPTPQAPSPIEVALAQAQSLAEAGKLVESEAVARPLLESELSPPQRSDLHYLLGWLSLKQARGREALDHFAQVQGRKVEPQALAAAFSLIGDEERALTLWELAYRESKDPTVLHEWAGSLIRAGREQEAHHLPGVDLGAAYGCAERVLFLREDFLGAGKLGEAALLIAPTAERAYDTACAYARAGNADAAVRLLQQAQQLGFTDFAYAQTDSDLAALHGHPAFIQWLGGLGKTGRA